MMDSCHVIPRNKGGFHWCNHTAIHTCGWQCQSPGSYMSRIQNQWQQAQDVRVETFVHPAWVKCFPPAGHCGRTQLENSCLWGTPCETELTCKLVDSCLLSMLQVSATESWARILFIMTLYKLQNNSLSLWMKCIFITLHGDSFYEVSQKSK